MHPVTAARRIRFILGDLMASIIRTIPEPNKTINKEFREVSVRAIAAHAGVNSALTGYHFRGKQEKRQ